MKKFDLTIWLGLGIGLTAIFLGVWLDGLSFSFLWHPTAALIVGGGTLGAVIIRRGADGVKSAAKAVWKLRLAEKTEFHQAELGKLIWLARTAQKGGAKAFESYADACGDALVAQGLLMVAEVADKEQIKDVLRRRLEWEDERGQQDAATLEAAGGFAPTFGIMGAVLGLVGVLRVLDKPEALGVGIATAFVATVYGIGLANLLFFPLAARLRSRHETIIRHREEIAAVIMALASREAPRQIANRFNVK